MSGENEAPEVEVGDLVAVDPPERARRFIGKVTRIDLLDDEVTPFQYHLVVKTTMGGWPHPKEGRYRCVTPDRVEPLPAKAAERARRAEQNKEGEA